MGARGGGYAPLGDPPGEEGDMLIIVHDDWYNNVLPLKNHKDEIGIDTTVVRVSADIV